MTPVILRTVLACGANVKKRAKGNSMFPFIRSNDQMLISNMTTSPRIGDIVVFEHPQYRRLAIHRIVGRRHSRLLVKGDNSRRPDGWIQARDVLGRVVQIERMGSLLRIRSRLESVFIAGLSRAGLLIALRKKIKLHVPGLIPVLGKYL